MYRLRLLTLNSAMWTVLLASALHAQDNAAVRVWEEDVVLPTYRLDPSDKNPMFYKNESYQGAQKRIYPYAFQEHVTNIREDQPHRFVFLENEYIKLSVLPEIGGRLFSATDKTNGYEIFYRQSVIKPALIGMLGAWISGGIEWCVFHHHRNTTQMPVDYTMEEHEDGSKTIWFGETERRHRMKWLIGLTLYPGKSYIEATVKMFNRTPLPHSILYWANVAVHVNDDYQVMFPPSVQYATYHSKNDFIHWPIGHSTYQGTDYRGVDVSWWKNHPEPVSMFAWDLQEDFMGGYDHGKEAGVAHFGNHHIVAGAKLWEWSPGPRGRMWDKILTDTDGPYAELMVGAFSNNQPDYSWIKPHEVKVFKQYWFPIREIGGFKKANLRAALNLEVEGQSATLGLNTTSAVSDAKVVLRVRGNTVFEEATQISPDHPYVKNVDLGAGVAETDLTAHLLDSEGRELISYQPVERSFDPELPERVNPPKEPKDIETIEELYLTGLRVQQIYSPSVNPDDYFEEALRRDPDDTRTNTIVGINLNRKGMYPEAEEHLRRALKRQTAEYTRPITTEAKYHLGLSLRGQGKLDEAYTLFYESTWDYAFHSAGYYQLAEISCIRKDFPTALEEVDKAISTNSLDTRAHNLRAAILRRLNRREEAIRTVERVLGEDPLDFFAGNERLLSSPASEQGALLQDLRNRMRDDVQNYLELASDYFHLGMWQEATDLLLRPVKMSMSAAGRYPLVYYYLGYSQQQMGNPTAARTFFDAGKKMPSDYCFPFRQESRTVLEAAMQVDPKDARAHYYMGNLLYESQPEKAMQSWEHSARIDPTFALTHRNLGWAYYRLQGDLEKAIAAYEQAIASDNQDPRFFFELDQLYEAANLPPRKRLQLLVENHQVVASRNYSFVREIMTHVLVGNYDQAIDYLANNYFHVREGGGEIHDVYVDAHLLKGLQLHGQGNYDSAVQHFLEAARYPENLSVGVPRRDPRSPEVAYYTGLGYEAAGDAEEAETFYQKSIEGGQAWRPEGRFYRALSLQKLGRQAEAIEIFEQLESEGQGRITSAAEVDFFAKFGEQQTQKARQASGYYLKGLGLLGLGRKKEAAEAFQASVDLDAGNAWARYQLDQISGS